MADRVPDVILFIGAGFSVSAGVPVMTEFVKEFKQRMKKTNTDAYNYLTTIEGVMAASENRDKKTYVPDLEKLMDVLQRLAEDKDVEMAAWQEIQDLQAFDRTLRVGVRNELQKIIREKCIVDPTNDLEYFGPIKEILRTQRPLDIFSVNYDDVIEVFCHQKKYSLEDGFALYWEPERFLKKEHIDIRLFKLHGSVLWYKTEEGAFYKILLKIPEGSEELVMGEKIESLIAYPVAGKPIHVAPLAYAMNMLRERLEKANCCVSGEMRHIDVFLVETS